VLREPLQTIFEAPRAVIGCRVLRLIAKNKNTWLTHDGPLHQYALAIYNMH
jgi:hypothetical protein